MSGIANSFSAVAVILLLVATGWFCAWRKWLTAAHKPFLMKLIMNIALPCMCINTVMGSVDGELLRSSGRLLLASALSISVLFGLSMLLGRLLKLPKKRYGVFVVMCSVSNAMFIGYPMCLELFGDTAVPYVLCYYIVNTTFFQTLGIAMLCTGGNTPGEHMSLAASLKRVIKPPLITVIVCIVLVLLGVKLPHTVMSFVKYMGNTVSPLGLIFTGLVIYELTSAHKANAFLPDAGIWCAAGFRFILAPASMLLMCSLLGVGAPAQNVLFIEIAMPVMTQVVVLSAECGSDEGYGAVGTCVTTLACFVAIPLLMLFV